MANSSEIKELGHTMDEPNLPLAASNSSTADRTVAGTAISYVENEEGKLEHPTTDPQEKPNTDNGNRANEAKRRGIHGIRWHLVCVSLYISALVFGLDTTIAADVQSSIIKAFGHVDQLAWIGAGFPLGSAAVVLPVGVSFTKLNMKWVYVVSFGLFEVGSAICGAAPNMSAIIIGRVIAGAGGAGLFLGCLNYFSAMTAPSERAFYISLIGFCWGTGAVLGPVVGGAFAISSASWRWAFYINLVIAAVTAPIYLTFLPSLHPTKDQALLKKIGNLDFVGFILSAAMWVTFAIAMTLAGNQWAWSSARTIVVWAMFGVFLVAYILQQWFCVCTTARDRSFPIHLLKSRTQLLLCIATAANAAVAFCMIYFVPIYFQFVHGDGALTAAVRLLPYIAVNVSTNLITGRFLPRIQYYMLVYLLSGLFSVVGSAVFMVYLKPSTQQGILYGLMVVIGVGTGTTFSLGFSIASIMANPSDVGRAIILQNFCRLGGSTITLLIAGQVFQSRAMANLENVLAGKGFTTADIRGAVAGAQSTLFSQLDGTLKAEATNAITDAMQSTFVLAVVGGGMLVLATMGMRFEKLFKSKS
ncbi:major facilitator superfamily domain-containing protein [Trichoderma velutinum]